MIENQTKTLEEYVDSVPTAWWWWRLPVVRHLRAAWHLRRVNIHYRRWYEATGALPAYRHYDDAVVDAIRKGVK